MALTKDLTLRRIAEGWTLKCGMFGPWVERGNQTQSVHWSAYRALIRDKAISGEPVVSGVRRYKINTPK
jgi:hypothetical protein